MWTQQYKVQLVLWLAELKPVTCEQCHVKYEYNVDAPIQKLVPQWNRKVRKMGTLGVTGSKM
jgi:hypothetical protein